MTTKTLIRMGACGLAAAVLAIAHAAWASGDAQPMADHAIANPALGDGDAAAGEAKSTPCTACHGPDGTSVNPEWPSIAGQHASYTQDQLKAFKSGSRNNVLMSAQALGLTDDDMADLAAYYASKDAKPAGDADPEQVDLGERIYRGGDIASGISACIACHGPAGRGNPLSPFPDIGGQHATYLEIQLKAYRAEERESVMNGMMNNIAARMTDDEIRAVSSYVQGLRPAE